MYLLRKNSEFNFIKGVQKPRIITKDDNLVLILCFNYFFPFTFLFWNISVFFSKAVVQKSIQKSPLSLYLSPNVWTFKRSEGNLPDLFKVVTFRDGECDIFITARVSVVWKLNPPVIASVGKLNPHMMASMAKLRYMETQTKKMRFLLNIVVCTFIIRTAKPFA